MLVTTDDAVANRVTDAWLRWLPASWDCRTIVAGTWGTARPCRGAHAEFPFEPYRGIFKPLDSFRVVDAALYSVPPLSGVTDMVLWFAGDILPPHDRPFEWSRGALFRPADAGVGPVPSFSASAFLLPSVVAARMISLAMGWITSPNGFKRPAEAVPAALQMFLPKNFKPFVFPPGSLRRVPEKPANSMSRADFTRAALAMSRR
jgi:hypothetical protein